MHEHRESSGELLVLQGRSSLGPQLSLSPPMCAALCALLPSACRIQTVVDPSATHNERAWRKRLPSALKFLLSGWWQALASQRSSHLYFTFPQRLRAGQSAALLFNRQASSVLAQHKGGIKLTYGFNGWVGPAG
jgi:hypothetical protein